MKDTLFIENEIGGVDCIWRPTDHQLKVGGNVEGVCINTEIGEGRGSWILEKIAVEQSAMQIAFSYPWLMDRTIEYFDVAFEPYDEEAKIFSISRNLSVDTRENVQ